MTPIHTRHRQDDSALARRVAAGDEHAFTEIDERHRKALRRYAGSLLRRSTHDAEDVVQDVLIRAHTALQAGDVPDELRPWLYRLTRNRAIDEVRRARWGEQALEDDAFPAAVERSDPETVVRRREAVRRLVEDLADLPVGQRTALLSRELDGRSPEDVAGQLGVSVAAAQMLATRARQSLIRTREARDADCADVRASLLDARERGVRASAHALRHVEGCVGCAEYQGDIRRLSKRLAALNPLPGVPLAAGVAKLVGSGVGKAALGIAAALVIVATGGIAVLATHTFRAGDPAPFLLRGFGDASGRLVAKGDPLPDGTVLITMRVRLPAGPPKANTARSVTLPCPSGMKLAGFQEPEQKVPLLWLQLWKHSIPGYSTSGRIDFGLETLAQPADLTVAILCRHPGPYGTMLVKSRLPHRGEQPAHVCVDSAYLYQTPDRTFMGTVYRAEPVSVERRSRSGTWARVIADDEASGWMRVSQLCP
ncbi:MAG TPA: RNA polymerase sigma factor [Solirubrobacteraceae bacterium]|nr:RNA polymerase sigma factor [Solirubrobacteraceae bacterium]